MSLTAPTNSLHFCSSKESFLFCPLPETQQLKLPKISFTPHPRTGASIRASNRNYLRDLPCMQKLMGKTIVIDCGGAVMESSHLRTSLVKDIAIIRDNGIRPVVVHGAGPRINVLLNDLNMPFQFSGNDLLVPDAWTLEVVSLLLTGKVTRDLVMGINRAGATATGYSGLDGHLLTARPNPNAAEFGFVGELARVDTTAVQTLLEAGFIPVIASLADDEFLQRYIFHSDTVASEMAAALGAERLILLTDATGILTNREDPKSLVKKIDIKGVNKMIVEGKIEGGMILKIHCCIRSLARGVTTAGIVDGRVDHCLLLEMETDEGMGTRITD